MRFDLNPNFENEIRSQVGVVEAMKRGAATIRTLSDLAAPKKTFYYVEHLEVISKRFPAGPTRFHVYVRSNDFAGHLVEWGSVNNPAYRPITRAALASGLRFEGTPKGEASGHMPTGEEFPFLG